MRIPLILFGIVAFVCGLVVTIASLANGTDAKHDVTIAEAGESAVVLGNLAESYMGDPGAKDEIDEAQKNVQSAQDRLETWESRRNIGFAVTAVGAVVALVGFATPRAQQVRIVSPASAGQPVPALPIPTVQNEGEGSSYQARLKTLQDLRDSGVLTDEEYESRRKSIIDSI